MSRNPDETNLAAAEFEGRVRRNQQQLGGNLKPQYDFIVCGSGSSGSVVARRLAENPDVTVLLLEAGGPDDVPEVMRPEQWPLNLGSERDWGFQTAPTPHLNGRSIPFSMGKVLGGGSSINVMAWARGHINDWDYFAAEAGDKAWSYESVLDIYRRIEDWHGAPDPDYRGTGGPVYVEPACDPNPIAPAALEGARSVGIPTFENQNGRMMEGAGGAAITDLIIRNGYRQSVFRSYLFPYMDRPNLTVLTGALVTRVTFDHTRATGVEFSRDTTMHLTVLKYSDERDAVRIANDSDYGLAGSVWTADTAHGLQIAEAVRTGSYGINMYDLDIASPFGGFKQSGIGREFAAEGLRVRRAAIDGERRRLAAIGATARGGSTMTADASPRVQPVPVVPVVDAVRAPACASISRRWSPYRPTFSK